jgi:3',5'-nucleoside bisphosphate phosphatase
MIDLHLHSSASDGTDAPAELVGLALGAGLDGLALTDHDTTAGWDAATAAMRDAPGNVRLVRGAEFSTTAPDGRGGEVSAHLLGYLFDPSFPELVAEQERLRTERRRRIRVMAHRMADDGWAVDPDALEARLDPSAPIGRPHLGRALVELGAVASVPEAFASLLAKDGKYYEPKADTPIARAVAIIRAAGGVAVWAHPFGRRGDVVEPEVIADVAGQGLAGVEVDHPDHSPDDRARLRSLAADLDLLVTGSSDYHGANKTLAIAEETTRPEVLDALVERATGAPVVHGGA